MCELLYLESHIYRNPGVYRLTSPSSACLPILKHAGVGNIYTWLLVCGDTKEYPSFTSYNDSPSGQINAGACKSIPGSSYLKGGYCLFCSTGIDGVVPTEESSFGLKEDDVTVATRASNISTMIESQFKSGGTGGWGAGSDGKDSVQHEQLMEQYVKEKMRDAGIEGVSKEDAVEEGGGRNSGGMLSEEDRLYTIPDEFKKKVMR